MTASSLNFPCQVQLMGLPPQVSSSTANVRISSAPLPRPTPPPEAVSMVRRNLFGSPMPGEIARKLEEETQNRFRRVCARLSLNEALVRKPQNLPDLIAQEYFDFRLKEMTSTLNDSNSCNTKSPLNSSAKLKQSPHIIKRTAAAPIESENCNQKDRIKPYARQTLITDGFNKRKSTPTTNLMTISSNNSQANSNNYSALHDSVLNDFTECIPNQAFTANYEIVELPKPLRATITNTHDHHTSLSSEAAPASKTTNTTSLASSASSSSVVAATATITKTTAMTTNISSVKTTGSCDKLDNILPLSQA